MPCSLFKKQESKVNSEHKHLLITVTQKEKYAQMGKMFLHPLNLQPHPSTNIPQTSPTQAAAHLRHGTMFKSEKDELIPLEGLMSRNTI